MSFITSQFTRVFFAFLLPQSLLLALVLRKGGSENFSFIFGFRLLLEASLAGSLGWIALRRNDRVSRFVFSCFFLLYALVMTTQLISYDTTFAFMPDMAFQNAENARLLFGPKTMWIIFWGIVLSLALIKWILGKKTRGGVAPSAVTCLSICIAALGLDYLSIGYLSQDGPESEKHPTKITSLHTSNPPVRDIILLATGALKENVVDIQTIRHIMNSGLVSKPFNPLAQYPFLNETIYKTKPPFGVSNSLKPNLLVIFVEGFSARTLNFYDPTFKNLTPNMSKFSRDSDSMAFLNYFNHTAATFNGLLGQLCSLHPTSVSNPAWRNKKQARYFCLGHLLSKSQYRSAFLDPHFREGDFLNDMLQHLGFDEVLTAQEIAKFLKTPNPVNHQNALTNLDLFDGLYNYLESRASQMQPFFVATYPFQTHAWIDTVKNGVKYRDGKNNALNTIKDLDTQFGVFWERFQKLSLAKNTIVVLTTDHAHYHEDSFVEAVFAAGMKDYQGHFVDRIPLVIHDPTRTLPPTYDARYASSLHFTPTIAHYMGLPNQKTPFMGTSIFERTNERDVTAFNNNYFIFDRSGIINFSKRGDPEDNAIVSIIKSARKIQKKNRVWPKDE